MDHKKRNTLHEIRDTNLRYILRKNTYEFTSSFMQNKANFKRSQINLNSYMTSKYVKIDIWLFGKTNPIQTQTKPILANYKAWQSQNKANSNPTCSELVEPISPTPKFEYLKNLKLNLIMILSLRVPIKMNQKLYLEERP